MLANVLSTIGAVPVPPVPVDPPVPPTAPPAPLLVFPEPAFPDPDPPVPAGLPVPDESPPLPEELLEEPPDPDPTARPELPELPDPLRGGGLSTGSPADEQAIAERPSVKRTNFDPSKSR